MNTDTLQQTAPPVPPPSQETDIPYGDLSPATTRPPVSIKETVVKQFREVKNEVREGGGEALESVKEAGVGLVSQQKEKVAAKIDEYTSAVKAASDSWKGDEKNPLAPHAENAARHLESVAQYLRDKKPADILEDLGGLARRRPEFVYGALFVVGLATVRFLKASTRNRDHGVPNPYASPQPSYQYQP